MLSRTKHILAILMLISLTICTVAHARPRVTVSFWTTEAESKRLAIQHELAEEFMAANPDIKVELVPVEESRLPQRMMAAYAAGALPDVTYIALDYVIGWMAEGILDAAAATAVINRLGAETFAAGPLNLAAVENGWAAVPADGWGQLLLYRKDLIDAFELEAPTTWEAIKRAADVLHQPPDMWGIEVATDPNYIYMQQVFEQLALSNGCRLVVDGEINLNTQECVETLKFYKKLATEFTPPGHIYWRQTRDDYLAGRAAMILWSPFILDELAGLRESVPVTVDLTPPLHERTGVVTAITGPRGQSAQWGQVGYFGIGTNADLDAAKRWVKFLLTDGYLKWLSMAPEAKFPMRPQLVDGWKELQVGTDRPAKMSALYPPEVIEAIVGDVEKFDRWGFATGHGACVAHLYGTKAVIQVLDEYLSDTIKTAEDAAKIMNERVKALEGCK